MKIRVLFFGLTHDVTGFGQELLELPEGESLAGLRRLYSRRFPRLNELADSLVVAVNEEIAESSRTLNDGDEVAFMPPVSGGSDTDIYRFVHVPISAALLARELQAPEDGAVVAFEGVVRNHSLSRKTLYLEYEAYEPMAVRKMQEIGEEAKRKFAIDRVGIVHRLGRLEIGETSVAIIVTAAHRHPAFEACHELINRLKKVVPIWKKEYFADGAVWAEGEGKSSFQPSALSAQFGGEDGGAVRARERSFKED
ncbi:MAG: molybdenum cofactor biosynthesis protein MoaE [Acidobacteriia bacterium]|nr:molybdenum cofactor biosynthesis protein MoaE [Terriglobia bacterium]